MREIRPSGLMRGGSWLTHLGQLLPTLPPFARAYPRATRVVKDATQPATVPSPAFHLVAVPLDLLEEVRAIIAKGAQPTGSRIDS